MTTPGFIPEQHDSAIEAVTASIRHLDPDGKRLARVFRDTFDQLYNGQRTGRFRIDQLFKTEKTHFGTLIEINIQRELEFEDGQILDFSIAGHEVDCKYSHTGDWMLPIESFDRLALLAKANDQQSVWSIGLIRVTEDVRRQSENRDRKTGLSAYGKTQIQWLFQNERMQPNALLQMPVAEVEEIMGGRSGQARVNELFRKAVNRRLSRTIVATVAQQSDYMKRVRANGGARTALRGEGYLILGGDYSVQRSIAVELGAEVPRPGELVSVRVVPTESPSGVPIDQLRWRLAQPDESTTVPAPMLPRE